MNPESTMADPAVYELTVAGELGVLLRAGLRPHEACWTQTWTIISARASADRDIVDLMLLLDSKGLKVEEVFRVLNS